MKKKTRILAGIVCLSIFAFMALGSGSSSETEKKEITGSSENKNDNREATIEEQVLIDKDNIKITAMKYEKDSIWGEGIKLNIENNSDKDYTTGKPLWVAKDAALDKPASLDIKRVNKFLKPNVVSIYKAVANDPEMAKVTLDFS